MNQSSRSRKRILPPTCLFLALVAMLTLHSLLPGMTIFSFPWNIIGVVPLLAGILLNLVADRALKKHKTTVKPSEESTALITRGPYAISRHPMYLGFAMILVGVAVLMGSLTPYTIVSLFVLLMELIFIRSEERMLKAKFGLQWLVYKTYVGRWM